VPASPGGASRASGALPVAPGEPLRSGGRSAGDFWRQAVTRSTSPADASGGRASGVAFTTRNRISGTCAPWNGERPLSIAASTAPNAHTSVAGLVFFPIACSGAMYSGVPKTWPVTVSFSTGASPSAASSPAMPKSSSRSPSGMPGERVQSRFSGFRSRWITPRVWASASTPAMGRISATARAGSIGPSRRRSAERLSPSTNSSARYGRASSRRPNASTRTAAGWAMAAPARASRSKRPAWAAIAACMTFSATGRPRDSSRAR
jgi:hypothetical protein